jgi:hypothetical protein
VVAGLHCTARAGLLSLLRDPPHEPILIEDLPRGLIRGRDLAVR